MSSQELQMSLEHQIPLMKKTQMSSDRTGSPCGLTSLLPMSCRGRAAAFARDLHSRLRSLGATEEDESENRWLTTGDNSVHQPTSSTHVQQDIKTFYDFELECESPSSPTDAYEPSYLGRQHENTDPTFYDVDTDPQLKEQSKLMLKQPDKDKNGFKFSTAFFSESPVKLQPVSRENGNDKPLYSPITFEGCSRQNSYDEIDSALQLTSPKAADRLSMIHQSNSGIDSDSEFESAKSDPSDPIDDLHQSAQCDITDAVDNLSITDTDTLNEEDFLTGNVENLNLNDLNESNVCVSNGLAEIVTSEVPIDKEISPTPEINPSLLKAETKAEDESEDDKPQRVRRCSSLKSGKTPPGTPGRKKIVRFADVLGLDLADVKTFMDEIPVIPKSAYDDLSGCDVQSSPPARPASRFGALTLVPLFQLPRDVTEKLEKQNVCLESSRVCDGVHVTICGSVRVRNLDFHKTVHIRYTMNRWKTFTDLQAMYVQGSCDGYSDRFQFVLYAPCISSGQRLELAVRFQCKGQQFWDSNNGANYAFDCLALGAVSSTPSSSGTLHPSVDWHPSFY
ncbi:glycogen-binding subunit 76A isoform X1 [Melitaea cinxia]|uniref:glycogen-binding subunit 76A isoform X1 n=2 Tax=Melitaea cinxia TaxID=113334 RepID=UPI001E270946|nr:glycogen-binding subunit 76A isoform X1 [Melitaea cinxia]